jgi:S-adenosylmethionine:tRNA ribosyltransferase-isomerase
MHEPGESHFELLRAFADDPVLLNAHRTATERNYRTHEFGDSLLIERRNAA